MADACPMIDRCFERQHPECYGRTEILPDYPREAKRGGLARTDTDFYAPEQAGFNRAMKDAGWMPAP